MKLGLIGAMPQEIESIAEDLETESIESVAGRSYHIGRFAGVECVLVFSRWGKVAAAMAATALIERFGVDCIIFTGVAGAVSPALNVGDLVIADRLIQHDFDVSAARIMGDAGMLPKLAIPFLGISYFPVDQRLMELAKQAAEEYLAGDNHPPAPSYSASLHRRGSTFIGTIASGDQFIAHPEKLAELRAAIPDLLCVEMEGAAVAQVCHEYGLPYLVIRVISDKADHGAPMDFLGFIEKIARHYSHGILKCLIPRLVDRFTGFE
ncbi:MAG TPA: 5'-methylthioadenosine/adenosylhomocysteine nucleosidase [Candidatus Kapabacteria bacterium]|nr:5'-methylthioadenosine/adenosylhomocysteine nucleosidase [Candidatus Kapabacteria bacterium]